MHRQHSRLIIWGKFAALSPTRPAELVLNLPPKPQLRDHREGGESKAHQSLNSSSSLFYDFAAVACGSRHIALLTKEGEIVLVGNNRDGQVGQPVKKEITSISIGGTSASRASLLSGIEPEEYMPYVYDLGFEKVPSMMISTTTTSSSLLDDEWEDHDYPPDSIACGSTYNIFYRRGTRKAVVIGSNKYGQLALGNHEKQLNLDQFSEWDPEAPWWQEYDTLIAQRREKLMLTKGMEQEEGHESEKSKETGAAGLSIGRRDKMTTKEKVALKRKALRDKIDQLIIRKKKLGVQKVVCGSAHTFLLMEDGSVYGCGSNQEFELGLGHCDSPYAPERMKFFDEHNLIVKDISAGASWSLFLCDDGRIYCCGANNRGQIDKSSRTVWPRLFDFTRPLTGSNQLMSCKFATCGSEHGCYVNNKSEVFIRGSIESLGASYTGGLHQVTEGIDGYVTLDDYLNGTEQDKSLFPALKIAPLSSSSEEVGTGVDTMTSTSEQVKAMSGSGDKIKFRHCLTKFQNSLLVSQNGLIWGLGSNSEGQIRITGNIGGVVQKKQGGVQKRDINLSKANMTDCLTPIIKPRISLTEFTEVVSDAVEGKTGGVPNQARSDDLLSRENNKVIDPKKLSSYFDKRLGHASNFGVLLDSEEIYSTNRVIDRRGKNVDLHRFTEAPRAVLLPPPVKAPLPPRKKSPASLLGKKPSAPAPR